MTASSSHHLVWFRRDLRIGENPAFAAASRDADEVTALFVVDPALFEPAGGFRKAALVAHLRGLDEALRERDGRLRIEVGDPTQVVPEVARRLGANTVHWNHDCTPYATSRDRIVAEQLDDLDVHIGRFWGTLVHEPGRVLTQKGTLSRVFTPFYKAWDRTPMTPWDVTEGDASIAGDGGTPLPEVPGSDAVDGGEDAARERLRDFLDRVDAYLDTRDLPAVDGTSRLSCDLRFGTLSPREIADAVGESTEDRAGFVRQLAWRDWYAHLLVEFPTMATRAIRPEYDAIQWRGGDPASRDFEAWKQGATGYPIVDAGMRQLRQTGWMHNRVRMIVGSFLVKDLLIDWRRGERWFRHLLVDGEISQNAGNWQWVAGCGTDAAPYFRIFNPWTQSRKFDLAGDYIRRWVPELAGLDRKSIHEPHLAAPLDLAAAGVILGDTYPHPIVDHAAARERTLAAYKAALG